MRASSLLMAAAAMAGAASALDLTAKVAYPPPASNIPPMGNGTSPSGETLGLDTQSLRLNSQPWLPAAAEFHYSRVPAAEWRTELLKVKQSGISIVQAYVFWLHHEEVQGAWNWTGNRDLRTFVSLCGELGLKFFLRAGPWAHGEARNGGFPDWLTQVPGINLRSNTTIFMGYVSQLYKQIAAQVDGLLWHQGGPIIGVQLENEYSGSYTYLLALKQLAIGYGLDLPIYSKTGWPVAYAPFGEFLPYFGQYADGFWDRTLAPASSYHAAFFFTSNASAGGQPIPKMDPAYPQLRVEMGGGMPASYHRRILMRPADVSAEALTMLGQGTNQLGYYMYHGGQNPHGSLSTLQESQDYGWNGYNDLPVMSYDFAAPIGEYGQVRPHFHALRRLHMMINDEDAGWGSWLASLPSYAPNVVPNGLDDVSTLRWAVRSDGLGGFLFVNNHARNDNMANASSMLPAWSGVRFNISLADGSVISIPSSPLSSSSSSVGVDIPSGAYFAWPFNLLVTSAGQDTGLALAYALAQPIAALRDWDGGSTSDLLVVMSSTLPPGVTSELAFYQTAGVTLLDYPQGATLSQGPRNMTIVSNISPADNAGLVFSTPSGITVTIVILTAEQGLRTWKANFGGRTRLFLSSGDVTGSAGYYMDADDALLFDPATPDVMRARISGGNTGPFIGVVPPPSGGLSWNGMPLPASSSSGGGPTYFSLPQPYQPQVAVGFIKTREAGPPRAVPQGKAGVADAPDQDNEAGSKYFGAAAAYQINLLPNGGAPYPPNITQFDLRLRLNFTGDCARVFLNGRLMDDNFYNGQVMDIGLTRYAPDVFAPGANITMLILPLSKTAPLYLAWPAFPPGAQSVEALNEASIVQVWDIAVTTTS